MASEAAHKTAQDFFAQLTEFSERVLKLLDLPLVSPWGTPTWPEGPNPKGAILHYTADDTLGRAVRWFMTESFNARASAHVVVGDKKWAGYDNLTKDLPLIAALPVTVIQCRPPTGTSWHATWTCNWAYGIEATNIGMLKPQADGSFNCWYPRAQGAPEWTTRWKGTPPIQVFGKWFAPWVPDQVVTIIQVLRHVNALFGTLQRPLVLGHEQVQGNRTRKWDSPSAPSYTTDKLDPGLHFPLEYIRHALFNGDVDVRGYGWFANWSNDQARWARDAREEWIQSWVNHDTDPNAWVMAPDAAWSAFKNQITIHPHSNEGFGSVGKLALRLLGYHVSDVITEDLTSDDYTTIGVFQRLMGLVTDSQPGPKTRQALLERLQDRGIV